MPKKRKVLTDEYLNYSFQDEEFSESHPGWLFPRWMTGVEYMAGLIDRHGVRPVVYTMYDRDRHPLYVGKTKWFVDRTWQHEREKTRNEPWMNEVVFVGLIPCFDLFEMDIIEILEINKKRPRFNKDLLHDYEHSIDSPIEEEQIGVGVAYSENVFPYALLFSV